ncbi:hypothetical protein DEO72_LG6g1534 [Vigna unguiculata]|uniref:Uncharacterized protein n=1 Tax=Vigna unguiculata TaxID=3917 RepID=A0A4D6MAI6_VIGUN|nr:hypothetical protein DEO72_LG6g1534 [Vigna unguiculata]
MRVVRAGSVLAEVVAVLEMVRRKKKMRVVRAGGVLAEVVAVLEMVRWCVCHGWNGACAMVAAGLTVANRSGAEVVAERCWCSGDGTAARSCDAMAAAGLTVANRSGAEVVAERCWCSGDGTAAKSCALFWFACAAEKMEMVVAPPWLCARKKMVSSTPSARVSFSAVTSSQEVSLLHERQWRDLSISPKLEKIAQARPVGETRVSRTLAQADDSGFERGQSRSGKSHSPKQGGVKAWNVVVSRSRLSEGLLPKREYPSRLSEGSWLERDMLQGSWHVKWMSGLELKRHDIDMRRGPRLMGWGGYEIVIMINALSL